MEPAPVWRSKPAQSRSLRALRSGQVPGPSKLERLMAAKRARLNPLRRLSFIGELGSGNMRHGGGSGRVEPPVHVPAGLEGGDHLLGYRHLGAIARVSSSACLARPDRKHAEVTQLDPISPRRAAVMVSRIVLTRMSTSRWCRCGFSAAILSIRSNLSIGAPNWHRLASASYQGAAFAVLPMAESGTREKRTAHAAEQHRPDVLRRREDRFEGRLDLNPGTRLV